MANFHDNIMTGYLGQNRTLATIAQRFHCKNMETGIRNCIRSCISCQMRKSVPDKPARLMNYIEVGMDLLGPFPETANKNKYIIVAVDYLTKWVETDTLSNGTAEETAQFFVKKIVLRHGTPHSITTDRGKCFIAEL